MEVKLYVGNLSFSTTDEELRTLFAQAGTVQLPILSKIVKRAVRRGLLL